MPSSLIQQCEIKGVELTPQRREVIAVFEDSAELMDAMTVYDRLRARGGRADRNTVYRCISVLVEVGAVRVSAVSGKRRYFQRAGAVAEINLVDVETGRITPVCDPAVIASLRELAEQAGYDLDGGIDLRVRKAAPAA